MNPSKPGQRRVFFRLYEKVHSACGITPSIARAAPIFSKTTCMRTSLLVICICFSLHGRAQEVNAVIKAEKAFAQYALDHNTKEAFLKFMDPGGVVFTGGHPQNAIEVWTANKVSAVKLLWTPAFAGISRSGDLAFTTGPWEVRRSSDDTAFAVGEFSSVWKKNPAGEWKNIVDLGTDFSKPVYPVGKVRIAKTLSTASPVSIKAMDLDLQFIEACTRKGAASSLEFFSPDAWINLEGLQPLRGGDLHRHMDAEIPRTLNMQPLGGGMSAAGDMAYVYGTTETGHKKDNYLRVWMHTVSGWKIILQVLKW